MNNRTLIVLFGIIAIVIIILLLGSLNAPETTTGPSGSSGTTIVPSTTTPTTGTTTGTTTNMTRQFTVTGSNFAFNPSTINVKRGDTVRIMFQNATGTHDFVLDEFNVRTQVLQSNQSETVQFVANKTGSFEYYCSVGNHRQMGMRGMLVVTE